MGRPLGELIRNAGCVAFSGDASTILFKPKFDQFINGRSAGNFDEATIFNPNWTLSLLSLLEKPPGSAVVQQHPVLDPLLPII